MAGDLHGVARHGFQSRPQIFVVHLRLVICIELHTGGCRLHLFYGGVPLDSRQGSLTYRYSLPFSLQFTC